MVVENGWEFDERKPNETTQKQLRLDKFQFIQLIFYFFFKMDLLKGKY